MEDIRRIFANMSSQTALIINSSLGVLFILLFLVLPFTTTSLSYSSTYGDFGQFGQSLSSFSESMAGSKCFEHAPFLLVLVLLIFLGTATAAIVWPFIKRRTSVHLVSITGIVYLTFMFTLTAVMTSRGTYGKYSTSMGIGSAICMLLVISWVVFAYFRGDAVTELNVASATPSGSAPQLPGYQAPAPQIPTNSPYNSPYNLPATSVAPASQAINGPKLIDFTGKVIPITPNQQIFDTFNNPITIKADGSVFDYQGNRLYPQPSGELIDENGKRIYLRPL